MPHVIQLINRISGTHSNHDGNYIKSVEILDDHIYEMVTTEDLADAKKFPGYAEAIDFYQQVDPHDPIRPDGKPNRPLTAWTTMFIPIP